MNPWRPVEEGFYGRDNPSTPVIFAQSVSLCIVGG